ncbi:MAG: hypothetical protein IJ538_02300 [Clostridia bacterium]|nr:hypothetical protein [Clostridia bacterium]
MELVKLFNVKSAEYGTVITIETKNDYTEVSKFDYGSLSFDTEDYVHFTNVSTFAPQDFNGKQNDYTILVNGQPTNNIIVNAGKISGDLTLAFYNLNGDVASTAELHILIEYYASGTKVTLTTQNSNDSVSYLTTYTNINGAVIKVVQRG